MFQGWLASVAGLLVHPSALPGAYLRVIEPGDIRAGDPIEIVQRPGHDVTVALTFRAHTSNRNCCHGC